MLLPGLYGYGEAMYWKDGWILLGKCGKKALAKENIVQDQDSGFMSVNWLPNPAFYFIKFHFSENLKEVFTLQIFDSLGTAVYTRKIHAMNLERRIYFGCQFF